MRSLLKKAPGPEAVSAAGADECPIPPGIRRSQEAYWRDLPKLLKRKSRTRRWVGYHGDERIGFGATSVEVYQKCLRRGLKEEEFYVDRVAPRPLPPWEAEEIESTRDERLVPADGLSSVKHPDPDTDPECRPSVTPSFRSI